MRPLATLLVLLLGGACDGPSSVLAVDLRTDLRPGLEFDEVRVSVFPGASASALDIPARLAPPRGVDLRARMPDGVRVAEIAALEPGDWLVRVAIFDDGQEVTHGLVQTRVGTSPQVVTVLVTRDCAGVECPGAGSPSDLACLGGRCVDPRCTIETPEHCAFRECVSDGDCAPEGPSCVTGVCVGGTCVDWPDDARCDGLCDPGAGCVAGPDDAGPATADGGASGDAGPPDAGPPDAGPPDAGPPDAGPPPDPIAQIVGGAEHTCLRRSSGRILCAGINGDGQRGDDGPGIRPSFAPAAEDLTDVVSIAAGARHTCALHAGGAVSCWGDNLFGALGDGTRTDRSTAAPVVGLSDATQLALGSLHSCALRASGAVSCWGDNARGQLGDGTGMDHTTPADVPGIADAVEVVSGGDHVCARHASGAVSCWGANDRGQLGDGTTDDRDLPTLVPGVDDAERLVAGTEHTCGLRAVSGQLQCWGRNDYGQLGDGTTVDRSAPVRARGFLSPWMITAGGAHTCVAAGVGVLYCFGSNFFGQIGDGTAEDRPEATLVTGFASPPALLGGGHHHVCAVGAARALYCWGRGDAGQRGDGTTAGAASSPTRVVIP